MEIKRRIVIGEETLSKRKELLRGKLDRNQKKRMTITNAMGVMMYGSQTWATRKEDIRRPEALEMEIWRRMEKVSWTEHNYKVNSAGNDWRRKSPDTVTLRKRQRIWYKERDKGNGTDRGCYF